MSELPVIGQLSDSVTKTAPVTSAVRNGNLVYIETYGCQMNVADSELMEGILCAAGYKTVMHPREADVILVNTCAVREHAEQRVIGRLGAFMKYKYRKPSLIIGVTGCMAEHLGESLPEISRGVDLVVGPDSYRRLPELLNGCLDTPKLDIAFDTEENYLRLDPVRGDGVTAWVSIMRGCDRFCTYCIVPYVRGREKSAPPDEILRQVRQVTEEGFHEVCLLGQTVNSYIYHETDFADLLRMVADVDGIERIRFTSPHPADFTPKLVETMGEVPEVCPHLHLPVQSGSDRILKTMRRNYTADDYRKLVEDLRTAVPGMALSTDVLVGFCGEMEEDFLATRDLVESLRFDSAFMFKYSPREGTIAYKRFEDNVSEEEKIRRLTEIIDLQEQISAEKNAEMVGRIVDVLVEGPAKKPSGNTYGRTAGFKGVVFPGDFAKNTFQTVKIVKSTPHTLFGDQVSV